MMKNKNEIESFEKETYKKLLKFDTKSLQELNNAVLMVLEQRMQQREYNSAGERYSLFPNGIPEDVSEQMKYVLEQSEYGNTKLTIESIRWAKTIRALKEVKTSPMPRLDAEFIKNCEQVWQENIIGLHEEFNAILSSFV